MPTTIDSRRGIEARDRLSRAYTNGDDIFDDLPLVLEEIAELFALRRDTFMTIDNESFWIDFASLNAEVGNAAMVYASYFDAFTSLSRRQEYEDGIYRHVSLAIMQKTYPLLASQSFVTTELDEFIVIEWKRIIRLARSS